MQNSMKNMEIIISIIELERLLEKSGFLLSEKCLNTLSPTTHNNIHPRSLPSPPSRTWFNWTLAQ